MPLTLMQFALLMLNPGSDLDSARISSAKLDDNKFLIHEVQSAYQAKTTLIRILLPEPLHKDRKYPVVYVLPVEAGIENRYGDGLKEIQKQKLHKKYQAIFVAPSFSHLPWYADHPSHREIRQESYLLKIVLPFIEKNYSAISTRKGRLLLGFSKSGWGAYSLLLRNPDVFEKAAAWDAPLMMDQPGRYGSGEIFGDADNFKQYQISKLFESQAKSLRKEKHLVLLGYGNFREQHIRAHELLTSLAIPHEYRDGPLRKHDWHSGWVKDALEALISEDVTAKPD